VQPAATGRDPDRIFRKGNPLNHNPGVLENWYQIVEGCRRKDPACQKRLYERFHPFALKTVFRYIYLYEEALEATNDGFVKFFTSIDRFASPTETGTERLLAGWIRRIMINTSIDLLRKKMLLPEIGGIPDHIWNMVDSNADAEQLLRHKELILLIKKLPPVYRIVFNMQVIDGYTHTAIARALSIPVNTSKSHLSRARALLKGYLARKEFNQPFKSEKSYDASSGQ